MSSRGKVYQSLGAVCADLAELCDPWWIIGSAAAVFVGLDESGVRDIDLLTSIADAERLRDRWGGTPTPFGSVASDRFRSAFARFERGPLPIDVMGGLQVCDRDGVWRELRPATRERHRIDGGGSIFTPSKSEQIEILQRFRRPKDLRRAAALSATRSGVISGGDSCSG